MDIYKKLFKVKQEIGTIVKDKKNPFFKSNYTDINSLLEQLEPILEKHKLLLIQPIVGNELQTIIIEIDGDNHRVESTMIIPELADPQKTGGCITYYRRYSLQSLLALRASDDDGNTASKKDKGQVELRRAINMLKACKDIESLGTAYKSLPLHVQTNDIIKDLGTELKTKLS